MVSRLAEYIEAMLRALLDRVAMALPGQCEVCRAWPAQPVCEACVARFAQPVPRCRRCALPVAEGVTECGQCLRAPPPLDACHAAVSYAYPWSSLISHYKFHDQPGWAITFATLLRSAPWVEPALEAAQIVLPMPLWHERMAARGFNQALELARRLAPAKTEPALLLRVRGTAPQLALDRAARLANVRDAFALDPSRAGSVRGRALLLVDDVMTSGATLFSAAAMLRQAGAASVTAVVIARTD
ncbi:MAG: ComF family protein [Haliea sp.]|nr:MAG: ComF family protein [Haliea sp.]